MIRINPRTGLRLIPKRPRSSTQRVGCDTPFSMFQRNVVYQPGAGNIAVVKKKEMSVYLDEKVRRKFALSPLIPTFRKKKKTTTVKRKR